MRKGKYQSRLISHTLKTKTIQSNFLTLCFFPRSVLLESQGIHCPQTQHTAQLIHFGSSSACSGSMPAPHFRVHARPKVGRLAPRILCASVSGSALPRAPGPTQIPTARHPLHIFNPRVKGGSRSAPAGPLGNTHRKWPGLYLGPCRLARAASGGRWR